MDAVTQTFPFARLDKLELSHSSRSSFRSCPRKFEFRKVYNNSRRSESYAGNTGSALHAGIQSWLIHKDFDHAIWQMIKNFPIKYQKSWNDERSLAACYTTLVSMINWEHMGQYEVAQLKKPDGTIVYAVEVPFILRISKYPFFADGGTICVDYRGFIDLILFDKMNNTYIVNDIKTTTRNTDKTVEFRFAEQCVPYGLVLESVLGNDINKGFEVTYWSTVIDHLEPKNTWLPFPKSKVDLRDWMQGYLFDLDQIRRYYNLGWFARNGNSCMNWQRPCVFWDFCETRNPKTIEVMLQQDAANQKEQEKQEEPWIIIELEYEQ